MRCWECEESKGKIGTDVTGKHFVIIHSAACRSDSQCARNNGVLVRNSYVPELEFVRVLMFPKALQEFDIKCFAVFLKLRLLRPTVDARKAKQEDQPFFHVVVFS